MLPPYIERRAPLRRHGYFLLSYAAPFSDARAFTLADAVLE